MEAELDYAVGITTLSEQLVAQDRYVIGITDVSCSNRHVSQGILIANSDIHCTLFRLDGHFGLHKNNQARCH